LEANELKSLLTEGNFVGFLGAGYAMKAGYPSWPALLRSVAAKVDPQSLQLVEKQLEAGRYLKAADIAKAAASEYSDFYRIVSEAIKSTKPNLKEVEAVAYLPFYKVITTNYDRLYEKSVAMSRGGDIVCFSSGEAEMQDFASSTEECVLHIHGDADRPKSIVIDSDSYREKTETEWYQTCIRSLFLSHPFLFLGFSFKDPAIDMFVNFCKRYLKFYLQHKSYALGTPDTFSSEEIKRLKDANIEVIVCASYDEIWKFLGAARIEEDSIRLIRSRQHASVPALHILKQKLGVAYAAARLYLEGNVFDSQSRIAGAFILNHLIPNEPTSLDDLAKEIEETFIVSGAVANGLCSGGLKLLLSLGKISGNERDGFIRTDETFDASNFQQGLDQFIEETVSLFEATYAKSFPGNRLRLLEFIIEAIEANCSGLASDGGGSEILNVSYLLEGFLTIAERGFKKEFEQALRLGTKNISAASAGTLRKLALAASAFQLSFYSPQKVLGPITEEIDSFLVDANVLLPILATASPDQSFNRRIVAQLAKGMKPLLVTDGAIQEIQSHLKKAVEEYETCGKDDDTFTSGLHLTSRIDSNAFQVAFSVFRETERVRFTQYVDHQIGWRTEEGLKKKLVQLGFKVLDKNRKREELERIASALRANISPESKKVRIKILLDHDAEYVYLMQAQRRTGLLSYDAELTRAIRATKSLGDLYRRTVSPVALASFMDLESLPDIDCKAFIRRLLPTGQGTIQDVVQTHYLSKAVMDGYKLSKDDLNKVMSVVQDALAEAASRSAFDVHALGEIPIDRATQIMNYIEPKFMELAQELDRNS